MKDLIRTLTEAYGPSGHEERIRAIIRGEIEPLADQIHVDALGNLIALKKGTGEGKKVMLAAHMDEIGLIISYVDEKGFFRLVRAGFSAPRKQVLNSLSQGLLLPRDEVLVLLEKASIAPQRRAETFTLEEWAQLWRVLDGEKGEG